MNQRTPRVPSSSSLSGVCTGTPLPRSLWPGLLTTCLPISNYISSIAGKKMSPNSLHMLKWISKNKKCTHDDKKKLYIKNKFSTKMFNSKYLFSFFKQLIFCFECTVEDRGCAVHKGYFPWHCRAETTQLKYQHWVHVRTQKLSHQLKLSRTSKPGFLLFQSL